MAQVKTWRVLHDGMKVGDEIRLFGDFMPEAAGFSNLRAYLNSNQLEETFVDESVLEEWREEMDKRVAAQRGGPVEQDLDDDEEADDEPTKKVVVKKPTKKSTAKKKTKSVKAKKGKISEQSV